MKDTIFALSTPPGRSAIAVVRLSGPKVGAALQAMGVPQIEPRRAALRRLKHPNGGHVLDEALVLFFAGPRSETGEDMAELHLHGGRAVVASVLDALASVEGCRLAEPGEFTRRGLLAGKLDLAQVEALADLIDAETETQRRQSLAGLTRRQSDAYDDWRSQILSAQALVEAAIDFSDEPDVAVDAVARAEGIARSLVSGLAAQLADQHRGEILRDGFRVVLAGPPNAGKSSLLNALARRDAAIVSEEAGTTRDVIEVRLDLEGWPVVISDTAGLRETRSRVEQEGIRRTIEEARRADLVLWLVEPGGEHAPEPAIADAGSRVITVETKTDLLTTAEMIHVKHESPRQQPAAGVPAPPLAISTLTGSGLDALTAFLAREASAAIGEPGSALITRMRHRKEITAAHCNLERFLASPAAPPELRAEDLRSAASAIGRLTGTIGAEEVLGEIFGRFCIGK